MEVLARFADEMAVGDKKPHLSIRKQGNLFLVGDEQGRQDALVGLHLQQSMGCNVEWISADEIANAYGEYAPRYEGDEEYDVRYLLKQLRGGE